ncbi:MAG: hypothetical protein DMF87_18920 [Acidobacteria bacterium]|nr:MAG: hypothetical protein DMF88_13570 [Acidobacteriota bacterium]PYR76084.1 MAG: hypothetical protein DMF87_18920 [Acidobacteriota bacterium]
MAAHSKLWYLEQLGLLESLTDEQRRAVVATTRMLEVRRGRRIYLPGAESDRIFLVKSGVIKIARETADRREI